MSQRVVVFGGSGQLGTALLHLLARRGIASIAPARGEIDLLDLDRLRPALAALSPSAVINAAAFTDVAKAEIESSREDVWRINRDAPAELARACRELGARLIHVSTDYVFDGRKRLPYREDDAVGPLQVYGRSKLEGERGVLEAHDAAVVVRTSTLFGPGPRARPHYVAAVLQQARQSDVLQVVRLPVSSPTYAPHLARGLLEVLRVEACGIVHLANEGGCSRLELAAETLRLAGLADRVELQERAAGPDPVERPAYSVLDTSWFSHLTTHPMPSWQEGLREYLTGRR